MPAKIKFYNEDPSKEGRGPGWYYWRKSMNHFCKEDLSRDKSRKNGPMAIGSRSDPYRHAHDFSSIKKSPQYPTNLESYNHDRGPKTLARYNAAKKFRSMGRIQLK